MDAEQRLRELAATVDDDELFEEKRAALLDGADALALLGVIRDEQAESLHQCYVDQIDALLTRAGRA
jgi:hypothetical protein